MNNETYLCMCFCQRYPRTTVDDFIDHLLSSSSEQNKRSVLKLIEGIDRCDFSVLDSLCIADLRGHFNESN